ncbi:hypothetical protein PAXRUDRAFT_21116 [Paxillus rubicundulus Ve08.2h10]|uniref:Uncharacterized protein n=1 Tax=Paxillus rubicundulus Ve08.2h10 TaxID=930991 RepID=A0A0D0D816_9AGAM|nr:hypothetical protein PAXRUDRAFT_21116 [Paxillus rubicundulus Ve08.2h10]
MDSKRALKLRAGPPGGGAETKSAFSALRSSASPLLRFSASPLLRFSASPLLRSSAFLPSP